MNPLFQFRERLARGEILGPRLFLVGPVLTAPGGHPAATLLRGNPWRRERQSRELTTETEARTIVRHLSELGVDGENIWSGNFRSDAVIKLRPRDGATLDTFPVGKGTRSQIAFDGTHIWVGITESDTVTRLHVK